MGKCLSYFCLKRDLNRVLKGKGGPGLLAANIPALFNSKCPKDPDRDIYVLFSYKLVLLQTIINKIVKLVV